MYKPPIKNLQELINDMELLRDGIFPLSEFIQKMEELNYEYDVIDGFEDVVDVLRPKFKKLFKKKNNLSLRLTQLEKEILEKMISLLQKERPIQDLEEINFYS